MLALGCSASPSTPETSTEPPSNRDKALRALKEQAEEVGRAIFAEDHAKVVAGMPSKVVELAGGREQMIRLLELNARAMKSRGSSIRTVKFEEPSGIAEGEKDLFGIVPFTMEMTVGPRLGSQKSFLIGVSSDDGKTWEFVDGGQADSTKVKRLFPNFPERLRLPEKQPIIVHDKN